MTFENKFEFFADLKEATKGIKDIIRELDRCFAFKKENYLLPPLRDTE